MRNDGSLEQAVRGGLMGEYQTINCHAVGYPTSWSYPKQHEPDSQTQNYSLQDDMSQKPANDRCGKTDGNF
jgi:hypothetical protein